MATDYWQVLKDLREEETRLESELKTIRSTIPGMELMAKRTPPPALVFTTPVVASIANARPGSYAHMGPKQAIYKYLDSENVSRMPAEIVKALTEGGIVTRSNDFAGMVGSTLTQMKSEGLLERDEDGWKLKGR